MKITLETLANSFQSIKKLSSFDLGDPKTNFKFMEIVDTTETQVKKYADLRNKIIEKYRDKSISNEIRIPIESVEAFNKEILEANTIEIDLDWNPVGCQIEVLKGFTANDMKCLNDKFISIIEE